MFVTDTEAAFIYCHHSLGREHYQHLKDVTEYMVVNLGGIVRFNMTCIFTNSFSYICLAPYFLLRFVQQVALRTRHIVSP